MSVADILQQMGENARRAQLQRGSVLGDTIQSLSQMPGQIYAERAKQALLLRAQANQDAQAGYARNADARATKDQNLQDAAAAAGAKDQADWRQVIGAAYQPDGTLDYAKAHAVAQTIGRPDLGDQLTKHQRENAPKLVSGAPGSVMRDQVTGQVIPGSEIPDAPPKVGTDGYEVFARAQQLQAPQPMAPGDYGPATPGMPRAQAELQAYTDQRTAKAGDTHSPIYKEWKDYTSSGGTLDFNGYQTMDANRKRPVSITNAATDDKMISEAATNILANPRDLTSIKAITSLRGDQRLKLFNELKRRDPAFNSGNIDRQIKFLDSYEDPKGKPAANRQSMNNILMHSADLSDVNQEYRRSNVRLVNTPLNEIRKQYSADYERYATTVAVLKDEIGLYFAGGYAPTKEQGATWTKILNDETTPNQTEAFAKQIIHVGLRRASTHNSDFKAVMGYDDPNLITPDAVVAANHLGLGAAVKPFGSGGTLGSPAKPAAAPPTLGASATHRVTQNGVTYDVTTDAAGKVVSSKAVRD